MLLNGIGVRPDLGAGSFGPGMSPARGTWSRKRNRNLWLQHHNVEISTERLPDVTPSGKRRTARLGDVQRGLSRWLWAERAADPAYPRSWACRSAATRCCV